MTFQPFKRVELTVMCSADLEMMDPAVVSLS